jgi:hypothetical protein
MLQAAHQFDMVPEGLSFMLHKLLTRLLSCKNQPGANIIMRYNGETSITTLANVEQNGVCLSGVPKNTCWSIRRSVDFEAADQRVYRTRLEEAPYLLVEEASQPYPWDKHSEPKADAFVGINYY